MKRYNYPTTLFFGEGALNAFAEALRERGHQCPMLVTDPGLVKAGLVEKVQSVLSGHNLKACVFDQVHPNPIEEDIEKGAEFYKSHTCDAIIALGGGSPMDAAKVIAIAASQSGDLVIFDDAKGGDQHITAPLPALYAIPTTAGTGSEVGRCGVITMRESGAKTIFFHPGLLPQIAVLAPELTVGLPPHITAATGIDAFTHCLEAFLAPGFDPMGDGIALEGIRLVLENLPLVYSDGSNMEARGKMLMAASMGATAFQKGLGMIHSLAHPLSAICGLHHGLANALVGPNCIQFIESQDLNSTQEKQIARVQALFDEFHLAKETLADSCRDFYKKLGVSFGLSNHGVKKEQLEALGRDAFADVCHQTNMIPVTEDQLRTVIEKSL